MSNLTDKFIDLIYSIQHKDIPCKVNKKLQECLADTIGVTLAGSSFLNDKNYKLLHLLGDDSQIIKPIGMKIKTSLANAILINGMNAHFLELDDGIRYGVIHPSAPLFSTLLPVAAVRKVSWNRFVLGAICGYETSIRLASAMQPSHYSKGYHPTATCCTIGAAVGLAVMLGYNQKEIKDTLSAATISSYGTLKVLEDNSQLKPYNCGKAALMGYYAATLAKAGFCGSNDALDGDTGFFNMMCNKYDEHRLLDWNGTYAIEKIYLKPYASCRHTHPEIEAAFSIRNQTGFNIEKINYIHVKTYKGVIGKHDGKNIYGESSARMSIPYSIAVALYTGKAGIKEFTDDYINNPMIQKLIKCCEIQSDDELSKLVPDKRIAIVKIVMTDGHEFEQRIDYPKGEPENPMTSEELMEKFISMLSHKGISSTEAVKLFNKIIYDNIIDFNKFNI